MKTFRVKEKCQACKGTGVFVGMGERDGAGIICRKCEGSGCVIFIHKYEDFERRGEMQDVSRVYQNNPGIGIGENLSKGLSLEDFGGMPYKEFIKGMPFPPGSEMRKFSCPAWWYQSVDPGKKPNWEQCGFGMFSKCRYFGNKNKCWERWDKEYAQKEGA